MEKNIYYESGKGVERRMNEVFLTENEAKFALKIMELFPEDQYYLVPISEKEL